MPCCSARTLTQRSPKPVTTDTRCWSTSSAWSRIRSSGPPLLPAPSCSPLVAAISTCTSARTSPSATSTTTMPRSVCTCRRHSLSSCSPARPPSRWFLPRRRRRLDARWGPSDSAKLTFLVSRHTFMKEGNMDHNEALRKFEQLMLREADHAHEVATELEALVSLLPSEKSRQLAQLQVKASHNQAKDFRELARKVKKNYGR